MIQNQSMQSDFDISKFLLADVGRYNIGNYWIFMGWLVTFKIQSIIYADANPSPDYFGFAYASLGNGFYKTYYSHVFKGI